MTIRSFVCTDARGAHVSSFDSLQAGAAFIRGFRRGNADRYGLSAGILKGMRVY
jgi:hypothetical protein